MLSVPKRLRYFFQRYGVTLNMLLCPICGGQMRIIAFITYSADIGQILEHIGAETEPPRITPARGPPLWDGADAQVGDGVDVAPDWDEAAQVAPDIDVDQRVSW